MTFNQAANKYQKFTHGGLRKGCYYFFNAGVLTGWNGNNPEPARIYDIDLKRDDWREWVDPVVIGVGDTVKLLEEYMDMGVGTICDVAQIVNANTLEVKPRYSIFPKLDQVELISKAPTVHVFEGVMWAEQSFIYPHRGFDNPMKPELLKLIGKTYTMTLTEEQS